MSHSSLAPRCAASFPTAAMAQKGPWHKPSRFPWIPSAAFPRTMQVKADLSALLVRKRVPSSQKGGLKVKMFHAHILPASALRSLGSVFVHSASVALSLHSCPLALQGHGEGMG